MDDEAGGIFNIAISDSELEEQDTKAEAKAARTGQTEENYMAVKRAYQAKVENGEVYKSVALPLEKNAKKQLFQEVMAAAEELYFFRRFDEAADFLKQALAENPDQTDAFDEETRALLIKYKDRCDSKLNKGS